MRFSHNARVECDKKYILVILVDNTLDVDYDEVGLRNVLDQRDSIVV